MNILDEIRQMLSYCPATGEFRWRVDRGRIKAGDVAGSVDKSTGYLQIRANYKLLLGHRLAWFMIYGKMPSGVIDHINRNKTDNRITNLRDTSHRKNQWNRGVNKNNTSGVSGVYWNKMCKKWHIQLEDMGRKIDLGMYKDIADAAKVTAFRGFTQSHCRLCKTKTSSGLSSPIRPNSS